MSWTGNGSRGPSLTVICLIVTWALMVPPILAIPASSGEPPDPSVTSLDQLSFATFLGTDAEESAEAVVCDAAGNIYITGFTRSSAFPTTVGAYDRTFNGSRDMFVAKLGASGTSLIWSTFVGGSANEWGYDIALDSKGNVVVAGTSSSTDFPTFMSSYDNTYNGNTDVVVFKLDPRGSRLLSSTYLGGSGFDSARLCLDSSGDIYLTGTTSSTDFPTTENAYDRTADGSHSEIFMTKLKADCSGLVYSTYLGGSADDYCYISGVVDASGDLWGVGTSSSSDFPTTTGCYDSTKNGDDDIVVFDLNATGDILKASTFIGGSSTEDGRALAIDADGNKVVLGLSSSSNYPVTIGAYDTSWNGDRDVVVSTLDPDLTDLLSSTYLGGSGYEYSANLALDREGAVYLAGYTESTDFPIRPDYYDDSHNGMQDIFVARLRPDLKDLLNSTYIGGTSSERALSMDLDKSNVISLSGYTYSSDFPATSGSYDTSFNSDSDAIALKFTFPPIADRDNDGVSDVHDAFPENPYESVDTDGDGMGDNLDPDADGDGTPDERDAFPLDKSESRDTDSDGIGDNADADDDNDGVNDTKDAFPLNPFEFADADKDGIGDNLDPDDDNDDKTDEEEMRTAIRRDMARITTMAAMVQTSLNADLAGLNHSLHASLSKLDTDFLAELEGLDTALASDIQSALRSISRSMDSFNATVTGDIADLRGWLDSTLTALGVQLSGMNSTLNSQMDGMESRTEDLHGSLSDDLYLLMVGLARIEGDLGEEDADIMADIKALSEMTANLEEHTLTELGAVIDRLAANVSKYDSGTAADLEALSAEIAAFRAGTDEDVEGVNETLRNLAKLATILSELEALDASLAEAQSQLDATVTETSDDQGSQSGLNMALIVVAMALMAVIILLVFRSRSGRGRPVYRPSRAEDIIVSVDDVDEGGA